MTENANLLVFPASALGQLLTAIGGRGFLSTERTGGCAARRTAPPRAARPKRGVEPRADQAAPPVRRRLPYLELIAAANKIADPLDERVALAYWVGSHLLDTVRMARLRERHHTALHLRLIRPAVTGPDE